MVDANFGQSPFVFDIEDMLKELRETTKATIYKFPLPEDQGDWNAILNKYVQIQHYFYQTHLLIRFFSSISEWFLLTWYIMVTAKRLSHSQRPPNKI